MPLKLYRINTMIEHSDNMAGFYKKADDIYNYFKLNKGNEEEIRRRKLDFIAGEGYNLNNINKTDFVICPIALLFSKRFVDKVGDILKADMHFVPCNLVFESTNFEWYACKIKKKLSVIDKDNSIYRTLTDGKKTIKFARYRKDIEEPFFIAEDSDYSTYIVASDLFKELCEKNDIHIKFEKPEIF